MKKFRFTVRGGDVDEVNATSQKAATSSFVGAFKRTGKPNPELIEIEEQVKGDWKSVWKPS